MSKTDTGRYSVEELTALAGIKDRTIFETVTKTMTAEEIEALNVVRNALASAKTLETVKSYFVKDYDPAVASDFIASLPEIADTFRSLAPSAVVKDGRGKASGAEAKRNRKHGRVRFNDDGTASVVMIQFPLPDGSSFGMVISEPTNDDLTVAQS
jgi:hypothetical protein